MLLGHQAFAQTLKETRTKQEMIDRTELLIETVESAREDLKKEDVENACKKIKQLFVIYPEHVKSIGSHLDFERNRTIRAKDQALNQLIFIHRQSLICDQGTDCEYVDPKKLGKELGQIEKSLKSQRKTIKRSDTGSENKFEYYYEF